MMVYRWMIDSNLLLLSNVKMAYLALVNVRERHVTGDIRMVVHFMALERHKEVCWC